MALKMQFNIWSEQLEFLNHKTVLCDIHSLADKMCAFFSLRIAHVVLFAWQLRAKCVRTESSTTSLSANGTNERLLLFSVCKIRTYTSSNNSARDTGCLKVLFTTIYHNRIAFESQFVYSFVSWPGIRKEAELKIMCCDFCIANGKHSIKLYEIWLCDDGLFSLAYKIHEPMTVSNLNWTRLERERVFLGKINPYKHLPP